MGKRVEAPACSCETSSCFSHGGQRWKIVFARKKWYVMFCVGGWAGKTQVAGTREQTPEVGSWRTWCETTVGVFPASFPPSPQHMQWKLISRLIGCSENKPCEEGATSNSSEGIWKENPSLFLTLTSFFLPAQRGGCTLRGKSCLCGFFCCYYIFGMFLGLLHVNLAQQLARCVYF